MIKYIKSKISIKIFLLTMVVLMGIAGISYGFVAALMPRTYSDSLNRTLAAKAKQLAESLKDYTLENAETLMGEFSDANQSRVVLLDEKGEILREWNSYGGSTSWEGDFAILEIPFQEQQRIQKCLRKELWMGQKVRKQVLQKCLRKLQMP